MANFKLSNPDGEVKDYFILPEGVIVVKEECHCRPTPHWNMVGYYQGAETKILTYENEQEIDAAMLMLKEDNEQHIDSSPKEEFDMGGWTVVVL